MSYVLAELIVTRTAQTKVSGEAVIIPNGGDAPVLLYPIIVMHDIVHVQHTTWYMFCILSESIGLKVLFMSL